MKAERGVIRIDFTAPINPLTATESTIHVYDATGAPVPFRIAFTPGDRSLILTPLTTESVRVSIDGIEGLAGERVRL